MPQLTERCDVWRFVQSGSAKPITAVYTRVPCLRVPISSFDKVMAALSSATTDTQVSEYFRSEGRASTDVFLMPDWVNVRTDDELRRGRYLNNDGQTVQYRYNVDGIRTYESFAYQDTIAVFAASLQ